MPADAAKSFTSSAGPSSMETPMTTNWSGYFFVSSIRMGISSRQGGHQVAQKFIKTTLPCQAAVEIVLPFRSWMRKGGAGCPLLAKRMTRALSPPSAPSAAADASISFAGAARDACAVEAAFTLVRWPLRAATIPMARPDRQAQRAKRAIKGRFMLQRFRLHYAAQRGEEQDRREGMCRE